MPIWSLIGSAGELFPTAFSGDFEGIETSSYTSTIGDQTSFVLGGTQAYNAIGSSINLTADWEELISSGFGFANPSLMSNPLWLSCVKGMILGVGGNTDITIGNDSSFNYGGESFSVNRNQHEFTCTVPPHGPVPFSVGFTLALGIAGLLGSSITARLIYGLTTEENSTIAANTWLLQLIPEMESTWLEVLKLVEFSASVLSSIKTEIATAEANLQTAENNVAAAQGAYDAAVQGDWPAGSKALLATYLGIGQANVAGYGLLLTDATKAQTSSLAQQVARSKANAAANPQNNLLTQVTADQYSLNSSSLMMTTNQGPMLLMSQDYNNNQSFGGIALNASQLALTTQGSASITMNRQGFKNAGTAPGISLMTLGQDSSAISLIAQQKAANSAQASVSVATDKLTVSFGPAVGGAFNLTLSNNGVAIQSTSENNPPQIQLGADSIQLQVGDSKVTINNNGVAINATSFMVTCGDSKLSMNGQGFSTQFQQASSTINQQGHSLAAGENSIAITNENITLTAATLNGNIEAGEKIQTTIRNMIADAIQNIQAALTQNTN